MRDGLLLDTSVVSELAPGRQGLPAAVSLWVLENENRFHLSSISVAEIASGIARLRRLNALARAEAFDGWLDKMILSLGERLIDFDPEVARAAGRLSDDAIAIGRHPGFADVGIAATARTRSLVVLTRNLKHFQPLGVECFDPFDAEPS